MDASDLHTRLLDEAQRYDPDQHLRSLLAPFRDVILLQRAKFMSYEQIAAALTRHGLKVSPQGVGYFCRKNFTKSEIAALRRELARRKSADGTAGAKPSAAPVATAVPTREPGKRGPKIARDDF